jgi:DUF1365 family protein
MSLATPSVPSQPRAWLWLGKIGHRRYRPAAHRFVYPAYFLCFPLSAKAELANRLFGVNRFNWLSFHDADHGDRSGADCQQWIRALLAQHGLAECCNGEVWLQTFPRVLGYVFNPVSFWYCYDADGGLRAVLAEVNNTFGESHAYLLSQADKACLTADSLLQCQKVFHVSPFFAVQGQYQFRFQQGADWLRAVVNHLDVDGPLIDTVIYGRSQPLTARSVAAVLWRFPLFTLGVVVKIHWQAVQLWLKKVPFFRKPNPPLQDVSR